MLGGVVQSLTNKNKKLELELEKTKMSLHDWQNSTPEELEECAQYLRKKNVKNFLELAKKPKRNYQNFSRGLQD